MANLKDIRDRIKSVKSIQKVTKAMKMVAELICQKKVIRFRYPYLDKSTL